MDKILEFLIDFFINHKSDFKKKMFGIFYFILMVILSLLFWNFMGGIILMPKVFDFDSIYQFLTSGQIVIPCIILFFIFTIIELTKRLLIPFVLMAILVFFLEHLAQVFYLLIQRLIVFSFSNNWFNKNLVLKKKSYIFSKNYLMLFLHKVQKK